jgi:secondary thiamine-phosphate synthase enzyme
MVQYLSVTSRSRSELIDITGRVEELVRSSGISSGICQLFSLHTTAAITVNESADPAVRRDIAAFLSRMIPVDAAFAHDEGNSDAHVKTTLAGVSAALIIEGGKLLLGTWQAIYFCEFDGPRSRKVAVKIMRDP